MMRKLPGDLEIPDYDPTYDEEYLKLLREKAKVTWAGVDVQEFMDMVRGRDDEKNNNET